VKQLEINKIYCGNSLDVLKTFPDKVFHCCITSPPYFGLRSYKTYLPQSLKQWDGNKPVRASWTAPGEILNLAWY
jgi:DNA modification methylase